ncbi:MAG: cell division protein ZapA [Candidatus Cryptobacteroides sp.]|nr:cell division protein ZapA [Rikenellaceae bacterium]MDY5746440.1 cell division protein ZapA [Candidatus Cryptobacteroides sp.]
MGQSITLKIRGKEYELVAETPEMERLMRLAAEEVDGMLAEYDNTYVDVPMEEKLVFAAVREAVGKFRALKELELYEADVKGLESRLSSYLESNGD